MNRKPNTEKTCLNCGNFSRHYHKGRSDMFLTNYGHCRCSDEERKLIYINEDNPACELWRPQFEAQSDNERIIKALQAIKQRLDFIELLIKDE